MEDSVKNTKIIEDIAKRIMQFSQIKDESRAIEIARNWFKGNTGKAY